MHCYEIDVVSWKTATGGSVTGIAGYDNLQDLFKDTELNDKEVRLGRALGCGGGVLAWLGTWEHAIFPG